MDNQHKQITGYRDLTQAEIDLMNEIKARGGELDALVQKLRGGPGVHPQNATTDFDQRWVSIGETHLQQGLMALTRAVARPTSF